MSRRIVLLAAAALLFTACGSESTAAPVTQLTATGAWARTTPPGATNGVVYVQVASPTDDAIVGAAGFTLFRTGCRYSVVILAVALLYAARRASDRDRRAGAAGRDGTASLAVAGLLALVVFFDQVPRAPAPEQTAALARQVASDRAFVARMEAALPAGAMVFQLPIIPFPEAPHPGVPA